MKIIYTCTPPPDMRNVGDQAQAICIHRWLARNWPGVEVVEFHKKQKVELVKAACKPGDLVFIHSGGNMCPRGMGMSEPNRRAVIRACPDNRIVSLPQTITVNAAFLKEGADLYNTHPRLTILARDVMSYNTALRHFRTANVGLCPDFVLGYQWRPLVNGTPQGDVLMLLRPDKESRLTKPERLALAAAHNGTLGDTNAKGAIGPERREKVLHETLMHVAGFNVIVTDRLHGIIFAILARRPCVVLPTVDHKLTASYFWFRDRTDVVFGSVETLAEDIARARASVYVGETDWASEWHDRWAAAIQGRDTAFELWDTMANRRSRRKWLPVPMATELMRQLCDAGIAAPSGGNAHCVRFRVVTDTGAIERICKAKHHHGFNVNYPPAIILVGYDYGVPKTLLYQKKAARWLPLAYQDVAAAMQNMALCAESVGMAACWVSLFSGMKECPDVAPVGAVEWISALFVGWGDKPWAVDPLHQGRPIEPGNPEGYMI